MSSSLPVAVIAGLSAALFALSVDTPSAGGLILLGLTAVPIYLAGLRYGASLGYAAAAVGAVAVGALGGYGPAIAIFAALLLPPAVLAGRATGREAGAEAAPGGPWRSPSELVLTLVGLGLLALLALWLGLFGRGGDGIGPGGALEAAIRAALDAGAGQEDAPALPVGGDQAVRAIARLPAIALQSWMLVLAGSGILAQALLARFGWQRRPTPPMVGILMPRWYVYGLAGVAALTLTAETGGDTQLRFLAENALLILALGSAFGGLAVVHAALRRLAQPVIGLLVFYLIALLLGGISVVVLAMLGAAEPWLRVRDRMIGPRAEI